MVFNLCSLLLGMGGQAGGEKYLVDGVFFKLARDFLKVIAMYKLDNHPKNFLYVTSQRSFIDIVLTLNAYI